MTQLIDWRDCENSASATVENSDNTRHMLIIWGPTAAGDHWTVQAELLNADYRQIKFSGLLHGGSSRDAAKAAAIKALDSIKKAMA
jgi:hypothetical protein